MSNVQDKPLNELLSRSMVDIYIGPENTHWILHEKLLCHHSPFFRKIFYSKTSSHSKTQSFGLPDEEDTPFKTFVGWLYSSSLPIPREEADLGTCFDLYLMAEKFQIPALIADVLQVVREWYKYSDTYPGLRRVQYIYANTEDGASSMRHMLVHSVARLMVLEKGIPPHWDKALRKNGQLAVDIIRAIQEWGLEEGMVPDAREDPELAEELVDVEGETGRLDERAEREMEGGKAEGEAAGQDGQEQERDAEHEHEHDHDADDSEVTVVDSPIGDKKTQSQSQSQEKLTKTSPAAKAKATPQNNNNLSKDFQKFSLKEIPNGIESGDFGTLA